MRHGRAPGVCRQQRRWGMPGVAPRCPSLLVRQPWGGRTRWLLFRRVPAICRIEPAPVCWWTSVGEATRPTQRFARRRSSWKRCGPSATSTSSNQREPMTNTTNTYAHTYTHTYTHIHTHTHTKRNHGGRTFMTSGSEVSTAWDTKRPRPPHATMEAAPAGKALKLMPKARVSGAAASCSMEQTPSKHTRTVSEPTRRHGATETKRRDCPHEPSWRM